jgi:hypothetical protein
LEEQETTEALSVRTWLAIMSDMSTAKSGQVSVRTINDGIPAIVPFAMPPPNG